MNNNNKLISIIVPVYNVEEYLNDCIDSILAQTYTNFELILVDDGSTDGSRDICDQYAEKDIRVKVIHKENGGVSSARNIGLSYAGGVFVTFVDSDDTVDKCYLESFSQQYDLSIQGYIHVSNNGRKKIAYNPLVVENDMVFLYCEKGYSNAVWGKLFRLDIIKAFSIIFPEWLSFSEDTVFSLKYAIRCSSMSVSNATGYNYFVRVNNSGAQRKYPLDVMMRKEQTLFDLYQQIYKGSDRKKSFMHELSLSVIAKYYFYYDIDNNFLETSYLKEIGDTYLTKVEQVILYSCGIRTFALYSRWRHRLKKYLHI